MPNAKLLPVDDTSLFYVIKNAKFSAKDLNNSLTKISNWEFQWKTNFNSDPAKQAYKKFQYKYPKKKKKSPFFQSKFCHSNNFPETFWDGFRLTRWL